MTRNTVAALAAVGAMATLGALGADARRQADARPEDVARAFVAAYSAHDPAALAALCADDVAVTSPDATTRRGRQDQQRYYEAWFRSVPDDRVSVRSLTIEEDRFVLELQEAGTYRRRLRPGAPSARGQKLSYPFVVVARTARGKIAQIRYYENDLLIEKQLGIR